MKVINKKYLFTLFLLTFVYLITYSQTEKVGINTTTPRKTLEVNGSTKIDEQIQIGTISSITTSDTYRFLMQKNTGNSKLIKEIGNSSASEINALGYFLEYEIKTKDDWIQNFDTEISSSKFWVTVVEANFNKRLSHYNGSVGWSPHYVKAFIDGTTWHLYADFPLFKPNNDGTWNIKLLITPKKLVKRLDTQTINLSGASTGAASTPIID